MYTLFVGVNDPDSGLIYVYGGRVGSLAKDKELLAKWANPTPARITVYFTVKRDEMQHLFLIYSQHLFLSAETCSYTAED